MHSAQAIDIDLSELGSPPSWVLADALSDRILRHGDVDVWKRLFIGSAYRSVQYRTEELTLLVADAALLAAGPQGRQQLVGWLGGDSQPSRRVDLLLTYRDADTAVRDAINLQRMSDGHMLRCEVRTGSFSVAHFELDGVAYRRLVGPEIEAAEEALALAARGVVTLSARTYELVDAKLSTKLKNAVVATEMQDETVTRACIALTPHASAPMSTFAGLGLSR